MKEQNQTIVDLMYLALKPAQIGQVVGMKARAVAGRIAWLKRLNRCSSNDELFRKYRRNSLIYLKPRKICTCN